MTTTTSTPMSMLLDRLWIDLAGKPWQDLSNGKTLRAVHHEVAFVLAGPNTRMDDMRDEVRAMQAEQDVPVLLIMVTHDDLRAIDAACGWDGDRPWAHRVAVRDANTDPVGSIRLNAVDGTDSPCEHGYMARHTTVARLLHKGDLFMIVDRNDDKLLLVYRALAEYDRRKNRVLFERTTPGIEQPEKQYMELAPNLLVYVAWEDIPDARPLSAYEARMVLAED